MPLGACLASSEIVSTVEKAGDCHGHTYSASPIAAAVGRAVLAEYLEHGLIENAARMGERLRAGLLALREQHEFIGEVRGKELLLGFDVTANRTTGAPLPPELNAHLALTGAAYSRGLIIYSRRILDGRARDNFLVSPALTVTEAEVDEILHLLGQSLDEFSALLQEHGLS